MTLDAALRRAGWLPDDRSRVWQRADAGSVDYSDGEASEQRLLTILRATQDRSSGSDELRRAVVDWSTEYHLGTTRPNLLRPLHVRPGDRVLELGAGCGALTRWLGEAGAQVMAVEGSLRRAEAAALRCSDLPNVTVAHGDLLQFDIGETFDWVLMIGVLEYASRYCATADAATRYLARAAQFAGEAGRFVLAIENQLGMKYLAGCSEDHIGRPYYGVHDLYAPGQPRTFGRRTVDAMLEGAGFAHRELLLPMPDYKLPLVVVRSDAGALDRLRVGDLLSRTFSRDYAGGHVRAFSESLAWHAAATNGLLPDLANSFLFVARRTADDAGNPATAADVLAWSYSTGRRSGHRVETLIDMGGDSLRVVKRDLDPAPQAIQSRFARFSEGGAYLDGRLLSVEIARCLQRTDGATAAHELLVRWLDALLACAIGPAGSTRMPAVPGSMVDATPANAVIDASSAVTFFDLEWHADTAVPLSFVVLRGLLGLVDPLDAPGAWRDRSTLELARELLAARNIALADSDIDEALDLDAELLREAVFGAAFDAPYPMRMETLEAPIRGRVELLEDLARAHDQVSHAADEASREVRRLAEETRLLRDMHADEQSRHAQAIRDLQGASARAHEASESLDATRRALASASGRVAQLDAECSELRTARDVIATTLATERAAYARLQDDLGAARAKLEQVEADAAERDRLRAELGAARATLEAQTRELSMLHAERNTFGGKFGRWLTHRRNAWLPPQTRRGRAVTLAALMVETAAHEGIGGAGRRTMQYVSKHTRRRALQRAPERGSVAAEPPDFAAWIARHEPDAAALAQQRVDAQGFAYRPLLSVILPVFKVPTPVLRDTLASLSAQTYDRWEACIAYADDDDAHWEVLAAHAAADARFRPFRVTNRGISGNSNAALAIAQGDYVALLDHDDTLSPGAMHAVVARMNEDAPPRDFYYTDKDSVDADGAIRRNPLFKPRWSPEMLYSVNYLTHFNVMRRDVVLKVGGWNGETDGAQDWDLFLRVCEQADAIVRVEGVQYHWRILPTSVATGIAAKPYAALAQLRCQQQRLQRLGLAASVLPHEESGFHVRWSESEDASVELVVHDIADARQLRRFLDSLRFVSLPLRYRVRLAGLPRDDSFTPVVQDFATLWEARLDRVASNGDDHPLLTALRSTNADIVVVLSSRLSAIDQRCVAELAGWLRGHREIAWACALSLVPGDRVIEAGRITGPDDASAPLFRGMPLRHWGAFGGPLWYRNASAASPYAFAVRGTDAARFAGPADARGWTRWCVALTQGGRRGLVNPHARVYFDDDPEPQAPAGDASFGNDPFFNPAFVSVNPLRMG